MRQRSFLLPSTLTMALALVFAIAGSALAIRYQETSKPAKVKRVKRPVFKKRDWDGIYFENLFKEGLVGSRPKKLAPGEVAPTMAANNGGTQVAEQTPAGFAWSSVISASTIEDEVKSLQQQLTRDITTPSKFKSDYAKVHQSFSMLSMLFGVVREYDGDVRWKKFAADAQASFEKAAANSRVGTIQAYESCKRRGQALQDLVRGGNFVGTEKPAEELDWSLVVGHSPIMQKLQTSYDTLKPLLSSEKQFEKSIAEVMHHADMIAVLGTAVQQENMDYADDDLYVDYAKKMVAAGIKGAAASRNNDYASASAAFNAIGQSCSDCHGDLR